MSLKQNWATGDSFGATDLNSIAGAVNTLGFNAQAAFVATSESTSSTSYADLTTTTDTVTVTIGSSGMALVIITALISPSTAWGACMSYALSGANTVAATDAKCLWMQMQQSSTVSDGRSAVFLETGLSAGSTVFKAKYRALNASFAPSFANRRITVIPFP